MHYSPVALFVYKRPEHTKKTLNALMECPEFLESNLYVFCDGAKKEEDEGLIHETRRVVKELVGDSAIIFESDKNNGLANSIIEGVTRLVNEHGRVIVLEDDLVVSKYFLSYMNQALENYKNDGPVMQISGYMFPVAKFVSRTDSIFLPFTVSWGWATWKRAWEKFDPSAKGWTSLEDDAESRNRFNLDGAYDYYSMMQKNFAGQVDSWAVRWYWSVFNAKGLVLFPTTSYVTNIGFDKTATHGSLISRLGFVPTKEQLSEVKGVPEFPHALRVNDEDYFSVKRSILTPKIKVLRFAKKLMRK